MIDRDWLSDLSSISKHIAQIKADVKVNVLLLSNAENTRNEFYKDAKHYCVFHLFQNLQKTFSRVELCDDRVTSHILAERDICCYLRYSIESLKSFQSTRDLMERTNFPGFSE